MTHPLALPWNQPMAAAGVEDGPLEVVACRHELAGSRAGIARGARGGCVRAHGWVTNRWRVGGDGLQRERLPRSERGDWHGWALLVRVERYGR
jgi:hypothetical protein